jgi:hypothetical protein
VGAGGVSNAAQLAALRAELERRRDAPKRVTWADLPFGDGVYRFHLGRKEIAELERLCGFKDAEGNHRPLGIGGIFSRMARGRPLLPSGEPDWTQVSAAEILASEIIERDAVETIRLALIGGGSGEVAGEPVVVSANRAQQLVSTYVVGRPIEDAWTIAFAVLGLAMFGVELPTKSVTTNAEPDDPVAA